MNPKVIFRPGDIAMAEEFSESMLKRRKNRASHIRRKSTADIIGFLGELAFERYLNQIGTPFEKPPEVLPSGDNWDFLVSGRKIDVKTSTVQRTVVCDERMKYKAEKNGTVLVAVYIDEFMKAGTIYGMGLAKDLIYWKDKMYREKAYKLYKIPEHKLIKMMHPIVVM